MTQSRPVARPVFTITGFTAGPVRVVLALILAAVVMQVCLVPAREAARWIYRGLGGGDLYVGYFVLLAILLQGLVGLLGILVARRTVPDFDGHLRWPPGRTCVGLAVVIGILMGLVMLVADYWPQMFAGVAPDAGYSAEPLPALGWMLAMFGTGLGEETIFRGLLVGLLVVLTPGRVRLGGFEISAAGVLVAVLFGVAHYDNFFRSPLHLAVAQQIYAFVWGLIYVWLMERSRSLIAPMVAHGFGNGVEVAALMVWDAVAAG